MNGRSGLIDLWPVIHSIARSAEVLIEVHGLAVRFRRVIVPHDRHELVNVGRHECVRVLETFTARPAIEWADLRHLVQRRVVPFPERIIDVAGLGEVVRDRLRRLGHDGVVTWKAHRRERMAAETDRMRVAARHQRRPRWRTQGGRVEIVEAQSVRCERVDVRRFDQPAEAADLRETDVIEQEDNDVRRIRIRNFVFGPPLLGILETLGEDAAESFDAFLLHAIDFDDLGLVGGLRRERHAG